MLPETVIHIGEEAFAGTGIKKISLPKSVRTLGWGAFSCVPEIEVYDTIDPEAKAADKAIDEELQDDDCFVILDCHCFP